MDKILFATKEVGSRYASRVRVQTPQGSAFDGRTGIVTRSFPESSTVMVRLDQPAGVRGPQVELPFGRGELVTI